MTICQSPFKSWFNLLSGSFVVFAISLFQQQETVWNQTKDEKKNYESKVK